MGDDVLTNLQAYVSAVKSNPNPFSRDKYELYDELSIYERYRINILKSNKIPDFSDADFVAIEQINKELEGLCKVYECLFDFLAQFENANKLNVSSMLDVSKRFKKEYGKLTGVVKQEADKMMKFYNMEL